MSLDMSLGERIKPEAGAVITSRVGWDGREWFAQASYGWPGLDTITGVRRTAPSEAEAHTLAARLTVGLEQRLQVEPTLF